ncbi:hypothetical protein LZF95_14125 [Algoriphagus sp. AGSA1]|uniref:hypothetical protein n=1 Tax=Algoriphagus sp. AGSA1 TaxID=2907213 RepID=UPI001F36C1E5|nr:hypothetical protein [Algoriphagus sp. AGSA1]MCE7055814.1 hypothetical protein [Algoriphagus sp. AGSA1]
MNRIILMVVVMILTGMPFFYVQAQSGYIEEEIWSRINPASALESDFIITTDGTKLFGQIISNYDYSNYDKVEFEHNGSVKTYFPADLQAFGLANGRFFMSKKLDESSALEFVQILFSGKLQLDYKKGKYYIDNGLEIQELRSYYQDVTYDGGKRRKRIKLYISTLKILTAGSCGFEINDLIERANLEEQDLIRILTQYHECEQLPYKVHVDKIPLFKMSPTVGVGMAAMFIRSFENEYGRASKIDQPRNFQAEAGIRLHDFRKSPRISFDLRFKYQVMSSTWSISQVNRSIMVTGSQDFTQRSIQIPFSVNFSFYKRDDLNIYFGLRAGLMFTSLKTSEGYIDFTHLHSNQTYLSNMDLMEAEPSLFVPGLKLGSTIPINEKRRLYAEIQADYAKGMYLTFLPNSTNVGYNNTLVSFNIGFEF